MEPHPPTDISDFRLSTVAFECRFSPAYLHWDRAGAIWSELASRYPTVKLLKAEPNRTAFRLENRFEFQIQLDRFHIGGHNPAPGLEEFSRTAEDFGETVVRQLGIERYCRLGLRPIFVREYPDRDAASAAMLAMRLLWNPTGPCFGVPDAPVSPSYGLRWEDKAKGCLVQVLVGERQYEFEPPFGWEGVEPKDVKKTDLAVDVDYYTVAAAAVGQVKISEWIRQSMHVVRRDINRFLGSR